MAGAFGGVVGTLANDALVDEDSTPQEAHKITQMCDVLTAVLAFGARLDPSVAYGAAHNASEYNKLKHLESIPGFGEGEEEEEDSAI